MTFDVAKVRADFPILSTEVHGKPLVYLDNAASTQKPRQVLDAWRSFYEHDNANVHRGVHTLSQKATEAYEGAREKVQHFLGAEKSSEIIFTRGTTEAINLVANTIGRERLTPGTEVLITGLEHHSNIVPWQLVTAQTGARLRVVPVEDDGSVSLDKVAEAMNEHTRFVSVAHFSNALGTIVPVQTITAMAHDRGIPVLLDGAQAAGHILPRVRELGCDFYAISGHKLFAPSGIGALYGRHELLATMPPYHGGGDMIESVSFEGSTWAAPPARFEAGTPNFGGAVALGAAIDYVTGLDREGLDAHEADLLAYGTEQLSAIDGLRIIGTAADKTTVLSFVMDDLHPHDIGTLLDQSGVAVRTGHHCAQPLMEHFGISATTRASLSFYNTRADIDALVQALHTVKMVFG
ncbi:MAG: cysteine desulfurase/selenocysteine lyase [Myxococcota bacterium]